MDDELVNVQELKSSVYLILKSSFDDHLEDDISTVGFAFACSKSEVFIMTSASFLAETHDTFMVRVSKRKYVEAELKIQYLQWNVEILSVGIEYLNNNKVAVLAEDASIEEGEKLLLLTIIDSQYRLFYGYSHYPCFNKCIFGGVVCDLYYPHKLFFEVEMPNYRQMKHAWNFEEFREDGEYPLERQLDSAVPIIQMHGWQDLVGFRNTPLDAPLIQTQGFPHDIPTCFGSPIYNNEREVVGIYVVNSANGFPVAIHAPILRKILKDVLDENLG